MEEPNKMLEAALKYASFGWYVFPCNGKEPATAHGFKDASNNPDRIHFWWDHHPERNVAIATGSQFSHLVVVDVDNKNGHNGSEALHDWEKEHGELPETVTALTGSGGTHLFYYSDQPYLSKRDILDGVDVRADGGYVIAPPSIHPETGNTYEWEGEWDEDTAFMCSHIDPGMQSLIDLLRLPSMGGSSVSTGSAGSDSSKGPFVLPDRIKKGGRTDTLFRYASSLMAKLDDRSEVEALVRKANDERCEPPLTDSELRKEVLKGALSYQTNAEKNANSGIVMGTGIILEDQPQAKDLPSIVNLADVWDKPPELSPELIAGVLREGHKMIISGPSKAGKSFLLIELAFALAEGFNWLGNRCEMTKVLYCNMEIDKASFIRRVKKVYEAHKMNKDIHPENIDIWNLRGNCEPITLLAPKIIDRIKGKGYKAVIIDPLYKVMAGDENSNSDTAAMLKGFDRIAEETGASVIYSHHFAKGNGGDRSVIDRGSGAGVFARDPDAIVTMTQLDYEDFSDPNVTAWRVEFVLREFANRQPVNVLFEYPIHNIDTDGILDGCEMITSATMARKAKEKVTQQRSDTQTENVLRVAEMCEHVDDCGGFTTASFRKLYVPEYEDISEQTLIRRLKKAGFEKDNFNGDPKSGKEGVWHFKK